MAELVVDRIWRRAMGNRGELGEREIAERLGTALEALRWAKHTGIVCAPDIRGEAWSEAAVQMMDAEAVKAGLPDGPLEADAAIECLADALRSPEWPDGPAWVSLFAICELVKAGLLTNLSGDLEKPLLHPGQLEYVASRPDLDELLAAAAPLGPEQAAARLRVRRVDFDHFVRLGWIRPTQSTMVRFSSRRGGPLRVPLYRTDDVDALLTAHPEIDWEVLRTMGKGDRSPLNMLAR